MLMRIAIIYPSFGVVAKANQPNIKAVADNYGVYPSMSLAYVAGALQAAGHDILFLDSMAQGLSLNDMLGKVREFSAEAMMFSLSTYLIHESMEMIQYFRKGHDALVMVGGAHMELFARETIANSNIDFGIIGEAEHTVVELIDALEHKKDVDTVDGICYRKGNSVVITKPRQKIKDLDSIPFPARNLLPMDRYYSFISRRKNYAIIISSRGCSFQCIFCEQRTGDIRYRSPKNVVDEFEECVRKYGVKEVDVFDPLFTMSKRRVIEICDELVRRDLGVIWSCRSRVDTADDETLAAMKRAGCYRIYYGIESGDEGILKNIRKFTKIQKVRETISLTKKHGILAFGYFIFGSPGDTERTIRKSIDLSLELPLDFAQFNRLSTLPGTPLYAELKKEIGYDYWKSYVQGKMKEKPLPRVGCKMSDKELDRLIGEAYRRFYFRPKVIINTLINIRSFQEIGRYAKAGLGMLQPQ
jgi:anaerobic magnesium-protoporphyrin IX monomethyl ester cyclase